jgi:hypothetical protein
VLLVRSDAGCHGIRPADLLKPRGDVVVIQVGIVTAVAADELERVGVTALWLAVHHPGRLAAEDQRPAKGVLTIGLRARLRGLGRGGGMAPETAVAVTHGVCCAVKHCSLISRHT